MSGETVEPGIRWEAGTSEGEAVIGVGESFSYTPKSWFGKVKGFDEYTIVKGRAVAVRQAKLLTTTDVVAPGNVAIKGDTIVRGSEALDIVSSEGSVVTPGSSFKGTPFGSLKTVERGVLSSKPFNTKSQVDFGGVSSSTVASRTSSLSGLSRISSGQSVTTSYKSTGSSQVSPVSPVSSGGGSSESLSVGSSGGISSGRSFGGSSSTGSSSGGSSGGGSSGGSSGGGSSRGPPETPPTYPKAISNSKGERKERKEQFKVEVRKKGVFKTIAITDTPQEAFRIGKFNVEQTASASLRVKPVGSSSKVSGVGKGILPFSKFRESTKEPDVFIQRRKFRIGTPGEKKEITYKGLQVLRQNKVFGRLR